MIESKSICLLGHDNSLKKIQGDDLPLETHAVLKELSGDRPAARKHGEGLLLSIPVKKVGWVIWLLDGIPPETSLPDLLKSAQQQSLQMLQPNPDAQAAMKISPAKNMLDSSLAAAIAPKKNRIALFLSGLLTDGSYGEPIVAKMRNGRARKFWYSNKTHATSVDELRQIIAAQAKTSEHSATFDATATEDDALNGALLCQRMAVDTIALQLPEDGRNGYAFLVTNAHVEAETAIKDAPAAIDLFLRRGKKRRNSQLGWRGAVGWIALVGILVFLAFPVTLKISSTGQSIPASATTAALPTGAYLDEIFVRPGEDVTLGQVLATFRSPELEQRKSEEKLNQIVEQINAQDALAQDRYAEFQLAEQRGNIARLRLEQIEQNIEQLTVRAPLAGRITDALPAGMRGRFIEPSTPVAEIQDVIEFDLLVEIAGLDAPIINVGQVGQVYFRGLSNEVYRIEVMSKPVLRQDQQTGETYLELRAKITDGAQEKLLVGLSGFIQIEVGHEPNIVALTRYAVEYVRLFAWKYLGLRA